MTDAQTDHTLDVPGATLAYSVIGDLADATAEAPPLVLAGSPMDSTGFGSLAAGLASRGLGRVLALTDPRNVGRSTREHDTAAVTPEQHAEDLHSLVEALGVPVDLFAA
jgi:pimeloyl-ACP methyl ester carboxylesterase